MKQNTRKMTWFQQAQEREKNQTKISEYLNKLNEKVNSNTTEEAQHEEDCDSEGGAVCGDTGRQW